MAIAIDVATSGGVSNSVSSLTYSHTCTGSNLVLVVGVFMRENDNQTIDTVTYNTVGMTVETQEISGRVTCTLASLAAPATGGNNVVITISASATSLGGGSISFTGANQSTPVGSKVSTSSDSGTSHTVDVSSADTDIVVDIHTHKANEDGVQGTNQTEQITEGDSVDGNMFSLSTETGAATTTMSWSWATTEHHALMAYEVNVAAAAGGIEVLRRRIEEA